MSLTLSAGQTRLLRAPSGLPTAPATTVVCPYLEVSLAWARPSVILPKPALSRRQLMPLHAAQLGVYYTMSRVNQGSINAKSTAGLTYQTQLPMLNTRPQQHMGQEQRNINEALCRVCSAEYGLCVQRLAGVEINRCVCVHRQGTRSMFPRLSKCFSQTTSPFPQI